MCGRFSLTASKTEIAKEFKCSQVAGNLTRYNIAPSQQVMAIVQHQSDRQAMLMKWGLIPHWVKNLNTWKSNLINARSETIGTKPSFRDGFKQRPCLIPTTGFYEWDKSSGSTKQPYYFHTEQKIFALAGIYEIWIDRQTQSKLFSCTILTTQAQGAIASIHDRMPIIVPPNHYDTWLGDLSRRKQFLANLPDFPLKLYPVSNIVNSPKNDTAECIAPIS